MAFFDSPLSPRAYRRSLILEDEDQVARQNREALARDRARIAAGMPLERDKSMDPLFRFAGGMAGDAAGGIAQLTGGPEALDWWRNDLAYNPPDAAPPGTGEQKVQDFMDAYVHGNPDIGWPGTEQWGAQMSDVFGPAVGAGFRTALEFAPQRLLGPFGRTARSAVGYGVRGAESLATRAAGAGAPSSFGQAGKVGGKPPIVPPEEPALLARPGEPAPPPGESAILKAPVEDWDMLTPDEQQALITTHKRAGLPPPEGATGAVGLIDWKAMTPAERQAGALADIHVKQMPGTNKIVGSPDLTSIEELNGLRTDMYDFVRPLTEKYWVKDFVAWYERQRQGIIEASGPDPVKQHTLAQGTGIYSPQSTPATNFTSAINQAAHWSTTGDPMLKVRTKPQMRNFANQLTGAAEATQGRKTGPFASSSDPTAYDPHMSTNDIWIGRLLGYDEGKFSRGFTPQEHGFTQGEMQRLVATANKEGWGGRTNWTAEEMQAIPWIELKAQSLMKKRGLSYEDAIAEAMVTTLESLPRNTTMLNNEVVAGAASGHMPAMRDAPLDVKQAYTNAPGNWIGSNDRHVLWQSLPMSYERPALPYTATYKNSEGMLEKGYGNLFRPLTNRLSEGGGAISPESLYALKLIQGIHGLFGAQEGSVFSQFFPKGAGMNLRDMNAALLEGPAGRAPMTHSDLLHLGESGAAVGMPDAVHYGGGDVMLTNFDSPVNLTKAQRAQVAAARQPGTKITFGRQQGDGVWLKKEWAKPPGSGAVTRKVLALINKKPKQARYLLEQFDKNPEVFDQILAMNERDTHFSQLLSTPERADLRKLRSDVVNTFGSLKGFFDHVKKYGTAGYPAVGAFQMLPGEEESQ